MRCKRVIFNVLISRAERVPGASLGEERVCHNEPLSLVCKHPYLNVKRGTLETH